MSKQQEKGHKIDKGLLIPLSCVLILCFGNSPFFYRKMPHVRR
jgi:hypothetical protein